MPAMHARSRSNNACIDCKKTLTSMQVLILIIYIELYTSKHTDT